MHNELWFCFIRIGINNHVDMKFLCYNEELNHNTVHQPDFATELPLGWLTRVSSYISAMNWVVNLYRRYQSYLWYHRDNRSFKPLC